VHCLSRYKLALAVGAAFFLCARPAAAEDPNMQKAMDAMFGKIGTQERLRILGHQFNVRRVTITKDGDKQVIKGKLSHHLRLRDDDQVHFTITKRAGKVENIDIKVDRSILNAAFRALGRLLREELEKELKGTGTEQPKTGDTKALQKAELDTMETVLGKLEKKLGSDGWEGAAKVIIANVALRVDGQGGDRLAALRKAVRPSAPPKNPRR
jgi:hypothetical protein